MPMLAEHLWRNAFGVPEALSIFLSDWPFPLDGESYLRRRNAEDMLRIEAFPEWLGVAREVRRRASADPGDGPMLLTVVDSKYEKFYTESASELAAYVGRDVMASNGADVTSGATTVEIRVDELAIERREDAN